MTTRHSLRQPWSLPNSGEFHALHQTPALIRQSERESNVRSYPRRLPIAISEASGALVKDEQGQIFLDCLAGAGALPLGHNHPEINAALCKAMDDKTPYQTLDLTSTAKDNFCTELLNFMPQAFAENARLQFCGPSGADAVEAAIKLAKTVTGRTGIISFQGGYHGMTHGALALTGNISAKQTLPGSLINDVNFVPYPYPLRSAFGRADTDNSQECLHYLRHQLEDPEGGLLKPAAIILEAIQGEGGVIPAPAAFMQGLRKICDELSILLIIDEVQTGFGRTGSHFCFEQSNIIPDILVMSKALGGGLPLAVIAFHKNLDNWQPGGHTGTFRGNQLAMISGAKTLEIIQRDKLAEHAERIGIYMRTRLEKQALHYHEIAQVRGRGLMIGIEFASNDHRDNLGNPKANSEFAKQMQKQALKRGLICELGGRHGAVLRLLPPLILTMEQADFILRVLSESLIASRETLNTAHSVSPVQELDCA